MFDRTLNRLEKESKRSVPRNEGDYEGDGSKQIVIDGEVKRDGFGAALTDKGLLYCGKCLTLKQTRLWSALLNRLYEPMCLCQCEQEKEKALDREFRDKELELKVERIRRNVDPLVLENTFDRDNRADETASTICRDYLSRFDSFFFKNGTGLYLHGDVGVGKTFFAGCIANGAAEKGYTVRAVSVNRLINDLYSATDKTGYVRELTNADLLIIDDLGAQRKTEYASEQVFTVIDERYKTKKPLIVTSNLHYESLGKTKNITEKRIADRIVDMCIPVRVAGASQRKKPKLFE